MRNQLGFRISFTLLSIATFSAATGHKTASVLLALAAVSVSRMKFRPALVLLALPLLLSGLWSHQMFTAASIVVLATALASTAVARSYSLRAPVLDSNFDTLFDLREQTLERDSVSLSVVIPSYNPGPRFQETVSGVSSVLSTISPDHEIIVVNDGSTDGSCVLENTPRVLFVKKPNGGKGSALALGFSLARGSLVGFIDADGDVPPEYLAPLFESLVSDPSAAVAMSSKREHGSLAPHQSLSRRVFSLGFRSLMRLLAPTGVLDSQVGCKVFRNEHLKQILPRLRQRAFLVDVEILLLLRSAGRFVSRPVVLRERLSSTVRFKHIVRMFTGLVSLSTLDTRSFSR